MDDVTLQAGARTHGHVLQSWMYVDSFLALKRACPYQMAQVKYGYCQRPSLRMSCCCTVGAERSCCTAQLLIQHSFITNPQYSNIKGCS